MVAPDLDHDVLSNTDDMSTISLARWLCAQSELDWEWVLDMPFTKALQGCSGASWGDIRSATESVPLMTEYLLTMRSEAGNLFSEVFLRYVRFLNWYYYCYFPKEKSYAAGFFSSLDACLSRKYRKFDIDPSGNALLIVQRGMNWDFPPGASTGKHWLDHIVLHWQKCPLPLVPYSQGVLFRFSDVVAVLRDHYELILGSAPCTEEKFSLALSGNDIEAWWCRV